MIYKGNPEVENTRQKRKVQAKCLELLEPIFHLKVESTTQCWKVQFKKDYTFIQCDSMRQVVKLYK